MKNQDRALGSKVPREHQGESGLQLTCLRTQEAGPGTSIHSVSGPVSGLSGNLTSLWSRQGQEMSKELELNAQPPGVIIIIFLTEFRRKLAQRCFYQHHSGSS